MASIPDVDLARIKRFCADESPAEVADQLRVVFKVRGKSVTISESRPPWDSRGDEWTDQPVAQVRYSPDAKEWSLYWSDRNSKWHPYDLIEPGPLSSLLFEIKRDPTCIFWG
jgi:Protein of unknown function (DUF3024)